MKKFKIMPIMLAMALVIGSLSGCKSTTTTSQNETTNQNSKETSSENKTVNIAVTTDIVSLDPLIAGDAVSLGVISNTNEGLFVVDDKEQIQPGLCEKYEVSEDALTYTFHLRDGIKWSNGDPVKAQDFVYAWQRNATSTGVLSNFQYQIEMAAIKNQADVISGNKPVSELGITAVDEKTIKVELDYQVPYLLNLLAFTPWAPVHQSFLEAQGDQFGVTKDNALYNGPYILSDWTTGGNKITLTKNPDYWDAANVDVDKIVLNVIPDTQQGVMAYENGEVENLELTGDLVSQYSSNSEFSNVPGVYNYYMMCNTKRPGLDNKNFRQAIAYAIDREALSTDVLNNGSTPAYQMCMKGLAQNSNGEDFAEVSEQYFSLDADKAKELWEKAKTETDCREITITYDQEVDFAANTAAFIQSALESTLDGLTVNIVATPKKNRIALEEAHDYDICLHRWGPDYADPTAILAMYESDHPSNYSQWKNDEFDKLYNKANTVDAGNQEARWEDLLKCNSILTEDANCIPLLQTGFAVLNKSNVTGITNHMTGIKCYYKYIKKN